LEENKNTEENPGLSCPVPISGHKNIQMAHGGGGKLMQDLIEKIFIEILFAKGVTRL